MCTSGACLNASITSEGKGAYDKRNTMMIIFLQNVDPHDAKLTDLHLSHEFSRTNVASLASYLKQI